MSSEVMLESAFPFTMDEQRNEESAIVFAG